MALLAQLSGSGFVLMGAHASPASRSLSLHPLPPEARAPVMGQHRVFSSQDWKGSQGFAFPLPVCLPLMT